MDRGKAAVKKITLPVITFFLALLLVGCTQEQTVAPQITAENNFTNQPGTHYIWNIYDVVIDPGTWKVVALPVRGTVGHLNALKFLEGEPCSTCLTISNIENIGDKEWLVDVQVAHPFTGLDYYTGFDVRGIVMFDPTFVFESSGFSLPNPNVLSGGALLNPDGYTLLFNTVLAAVGLAGFDPYLGFMHTAEYGRPSLALDLMEEWRPVIIDTLILSVINLKVLTIKDFDFESYEEDLEIVGKSPEERSDSEDYDKDDHKVRLPVKLTDSGFRKYISQFERKMSQKVQYHLRDQNVSYRDCIREQVYHFSRYIKGEDDSYSPMPLK